MGRLSDCSIFALEDTKGGDAIAAFSR